MMSESVIQSNWNSTSECPSCFYGSMCQLTTLYYSISIESLSEHWIISQRTITAIILILLLFSTICNILAMITFRQPKPREIGSGIYRLWLCIIGQFGTMIVGIRLYRIFIRQSSHIVDCFLLEYLMSVVPALYNSLTVCVVIERTFVAYLHLSFDKQRSRHAAKIVIPLLILYHCLISIPESFHRRLISDPHSSDRLWCSFHRHSWFLKTYERTTNILHLVLPFLFNLFGPLIMIQILLRHKATLNKNSTTWSNLKKVIFTYSHNIISPYLLVLLLTPRLVLTFSFICITQSWQNIAYLIAYFLSLVPLMTSLFIFVLPSSERRKELREIFQHAIRYVRVTQFGR